MPILPAFLLMAQAGLTERIEIPILHQRPSRMIKVFTKGDGLAVEGVTMKPHDLEGTITLIGPRSGIEEVKSRLSLFDNEPRKVSLKLLVESPLDHAKWTAKLQISNNSRWAGKDEQTGTDLAIAPRLNDDNTVTLFLEAASTDTPAVNIVLRAKLNVANWIGLPVDKSAVIGPGAEKVKGLRITVTYVDDPS